MKGLNVVIEFVEFCYVFGESIFVSMVEWGMF